MCEFIAGLLVLFHWSIYLGIFIFGISILCFFLFCFLILSLSYCFVIISLYYNLKSWIIIPPALLFFLKIILGLSSLSWIQLNVTIVCVIWKIYKGFNSKVIMIILFKTGKRTEWVFFFKEDMQMGSRTCEDVQCHNSSGDQNQNLSALSPHTC
jgi:hypothetical protein